MITESLVGIAKIAIIGQNQWQNTSLFA